MVNKISDNISFIECGKGYPLANSLLIEDETRLLIDTGLRRPVIKKMIKEQKIDFIINSHWHEDHMIGNNLFTDSKICAHKLDVHAIKSIEEFKNRYGAGISAEFKRYIDSFVQGIHLRESRVDMEFEDGYIFDLGSNTLQVIHTPGHSIGHCSFFETNQKILFSADIDLTSFGPWYGCTDSDIDDFLKSIKKLKNLKPEIVVTSHHRGLIEDDIQNRFDRYLRRIHEREEKLLDFLKVERTFEEVVNRAIIYENSKLPKELFLPFETVMVKKHLERLISLDLVTKDDNSESKAKDKGKEKFKAV